MKIRKLKAIEIKPRPPFNFDATFHKPDHFTSGDHYWEPGSRWQTWWWEGSRFGLKFENRGKIDKPKVLATVYGDLKSGDNLPPSLIEEVKYRYNLDLDLTGFYKRFRKDKTLGPIMKKWRGMRPGHPSSLYEYLIIGIVLQNATVKRSVRMFRTLLENYGKLLEFDGKKLWCFWGPGDLKNVSEEDLRVLKVGYRAKSIKKIDHDFGQGIVNEFELRGQDRETQMTELLKLYGVGPATVWYLLFDVFHHWDFLTTFRLGSRKFTPSSFLIRTRKNPFP